MKNVKLVVHFNNDGSTYANFEHDGKNPVDWNAISDKEYENMMLNAIKTIKEWHRNYISESPSVQPVPSVPNTQMSNRSGVIKKKINH